MNDSLEQAILLRPAALPNLEAVEDEAGADDDEEDGFIATKVIVLEFCVAILCLFRVFRFQFFSRSMLGF